MSFYVEVEFKEGDKLVCKKSFISTPVAYHKDCEYEVASIHRKGSTNIFMRETFVNMKYEKYETHIFTTKNRSKINYPYLWEYFYKKNELREDKLNKLLE